MATPMEEDHINPLKRSFSSVSNLQSDPCDHDHNNATHQPDSTVTKEFSPRSYQVKVFEVAMKRNTIAVLETGAGKTMIAVMLIREIGLAIKSSGLKRLIIFLAPTVHLVNQQYEVIKVNTDFEVGEYYGAKGVDDWTLKFWEKEIDEHDVLVMTPQILLDALRKAFLSLEMVSLMIIDECHRTTGNHPCTKIMKDFYHKLSSKPKIFGMTASPVVRKGVSSAMDCEDQISQLETVLDSQIYTIEDKAEINVHVPSARETCRFFNKASFCSLDIKSKIEASWSKCDDSLQSLQGSIQSRYRDADDKHKLMKQRLSNDCSKILNCLEDLGLVCAYEAVKVCVENAPNSAEECEFYKDISMKYKDFLEEVLIIIGESLPPGDNYFLDLGFDYLKAVDLGYISPKLYELLQVFLSFGRDKEILCLIFVDRIVTAKVIERFVKKVAVLSHFTVSYVTGSTTSVDALTPKIQKKTMESFRSGRVNLLFSTDVLREGIHVPNCSCVVCFDLPKTVCCYVQSRGRARQSDSQYVIMLERGNVKQRDQLFDFIRSEWLVTNTAINRDPDVWTMKICIPEETKAYFVDATGASVTADSSVTLIQRYCSKLPSDRYFTPKPKFEFESFEQSFLCKLMLPASAAFQTIVGPESRSQNLAKQLVCLEACKKLHQMGALDDHLLPSVHVPEDDLTVRSRGALAGAGTKKRKELHGTASIRALSGSWGGNLDGATFHAYKFDFSCNIANEKYSQFILLIESKLDDDAGNFELDLFLIRKTVKASVSFCGQVHLDAEQMMKAKCFHQLLFNALFGRLFTGSKSSGSPREFLLQQETSLLWNPSYMYFLLPLETFTASSDESWKINWGGVGVCTTVVEFLKKNYSLGAEYHNGETACSSYIESSNGNAIYFANSSVDIDKVENMVVLAVHTCKLYSVVEVMNGSSSETSFEQNVGDKPSKYSSYSEYFKEKYGIVLMHPTQPLLLLKQSHKPHNLLSPSDEDTSKAGMVVEKERQYARMPPELLVSIDLSHQTLKSFYLLPSVMYRLESLMLASQLRQEIDCQVPSFHIPSSLMLEAITTLRSCETFSMERLELLGDSVLKYSVSCDLFLRYPEKHEGQLSDQRTRAVCNSALHQLGITHKIQGYIRDNAFIPRFWVAPGQRPAFNSPCTCGVDTLEVPLDAKFQTENLNVQIAICCSLGHRWMCSKTVSDCVEAIIGAYYVSGGLIAAQHVMKWFGMDVKFDPLLVDEYIKNASLQSYTPKEEEIKSLESKVGYKFSIEFLLQEAMTHASMQEHGIGYCYQRLEFLGDAGLDLLITRHLYQNHTDIDPGELTDLRSACVSNENFAQVVVRKDLWKHLQHCSTLLLSQISEYLKSFSESDEATKSAAGPKGPKALGDLLESITGAVLIDTKFNLEEVWRIFMPLLSPLANPENLELPPLRELMQLCDSRGYFLKDKCVSKNDDTVHAELRLQIFDVLLVGDGYERSKKSAKEKAAAHLLKELEERGITYSRGDSKKRKQDSNVLVDSSSIDITNAKPITHKNPKKLENQSPSGSGRDPSAASNCKDNPPVIEAIDMKKGGPRTDLFKLCKKLHWTMPSFKTTEQKSSTLISFGEGIERYNCFVSKITLTVPEYATIECTGDRKPDKKSSLDSAALAMLYELQEQGQLIIDDLRNKLPTGSDNCSQIQENIEQLENKPTDLPESMA